MKEDAEDIEAIDRSLAALKDSSITDANKLKTLYELEVWLHHQHKPVQGSATLDAFLKSSTALWLVLVMKPEVTKETCVQTLVQAIKLWKIPPPPKFLRKKYRQPSKIFGAAPKFFQNNDEVYRVLCVKLSATKGK
ncbi:hypothetical protein B566_EDAN001485 [Ephemera danica]|nr:hypothetical protein B566_EDAN001485 [Ephemera danica]